MKSARGLLSRRKPSDLLRTEELQDFLSDGGAMLLEVFIRLRHYKPADMEVVAVIDALIEKLSLSSRRRARAYGAAAWYFIRSENVSGSIAARRAQIAALEEAQRVVEPPLEGDDESDIRVQRQEANYYLLDMGAMPEDDYMSRELEFLVRYYIEGKERMRMMRDYLKLALFAVNHDRKKWLPALLCGLCMVEGARDLPPAVKDPGLFKTKGGRSIFARNPVSYIEKSLLPMLNTLVDGVQNNEPKIVACSVCQGNTIKIHEGPVVCNGCAKPKGR